MPISDNVGKLVINSSGTAEVRHKRNLTLEMGRIWHLQVPPCKAAPDRKFCRWQRWLGSEVKDKRAPVYESGFVFVVVSW